jgi:hypothetical protein
MEERVKELLRAKEFLNYLGNGKSIYEIEAEEGDEEPNYHEIVEEGDEDDEDDEEVEEE